MVDCNLAGAKVIHKAFGEGTVLSQTLCPNDKIMLFIEFSGVVEEYIYPDAFEQTLSLVDNQLYEAISTDLKKLKIQKQKDRESQIKKWKTTIRPLINIEDTTKQDSILAAKRNRNGKSGINKNIVFKCNYSDGGRNAETIGFNGVCSDRMIKYNINNEKRKWCTQQDCLCMRYNQGQIARRDLDNAFHSSFICYECSMLRDWKVMSALYANCERKGQIIKPLYTDKNSLAVLTTRYPGEKEDERVVFAVFLIDEVRRGAFAENDSVVASPIYRMHFSPIECRKLLFWKYYSNVGDPSRPAWASGMFRYFSDIEAVQLLKDIVKVKKHTKDAELAKDFLQYYSLLHDIEVSDVPDPKGALLI